jgi:hypothetical protein
MPTTWLLFSMCVTAFAGLGLLYYYRTKPRQMVIAKRLNGTTELKTASKVVTLTKESAAADSN